ncbi:hypothetical protein Nepgr_030096 [Nepenthes gracilis]|uniref:Uncharacterized protein n=1 Tax=Nepenthes gracilis TaxID=150966 RepID=A0AAD3TFR7_NEPGR|nr:hypothetical protein Nepgr_030096 [Nepenthes gracilis]
MPNSLQKLSCEVVSLRRLLETFKANWSQSFRAGPNYAGQGASLVGDQMGLQPNLMIPLKLNGEVSVRHEASTMDEDDQEDFHDPTLDALRMLLEANAT